MEIENKEHKSIVEVDKSGGSVVEIPLDFLNMAGIKLGDNVNVEVCLDGDTVEDGRTSSEYCIVISAIKGPAPVVVATES